MMGTCPRWTSAWLKESSDLAIGQYMIAGKENDAIVFLLFFGQMAISRKKKIYKW